MSLPAIRRAAPVPLLLALGLVSCARGAEDAPAASSAWYDLSGRIDAERPADRLVQASALFLGTPYADGPLGEGDAGGPDPDPRVDLGRADCVTYLEQSLALALCRGGDRRVPAADPFLRLLDRIRYRDGEVGFATRNHYMALDWLPANAWLVEDVTDRLRSGATIEVTRAIDRATFLRGHGAEPRPGLDDPRDLTLRIVPRESLDAVAGAIESGDLVFWVGSKDGIDVVHTGLAVRAGGTLLFRHASSKAKAVTEEPLADYAARATFARGLLVIRLRPDATG